LALATNVTVQIEQNGVIAATVFSGFMPAGQAQVFWDGGAAPAGAYTASLIVAGPFGTTQRAAAFTLTR